MGVYIPYTRLPSAYQEVEYIQSSGTQYFVVGTSFKTSYKSVTDFQMTQTGGDQVVIGVNYGYRYGINAYSSKFKVITGGGSWSDTISEDTNRHTLTIDKSIATVDGNNYTISGYTNVTVNGGIGVFAHNDNGVGNYFARVKMYNLEIYDENGVLIYHLLPCYRKSDSVIGMYDLVNNVFYTNQGTGTFSKGADITMVELKNAYIGEVYEYSYDFRNKSVAICQADGWTFSSTSTVTINSDGLSGGTTPTNVYCIPSGLTTALSGANKVTMEMMFYKGSRTGNSGTNATLYLAGPSSYISNGTGMGCGFEEISGSFYYSIFIRCLGSDKFRNQYTVNNGTYTSKLIIDLVNKTMRGVYGNIVDTTQSLTDAQISTIRTLKYVRIYTDTSAIIKTVGITVE